MAVFAQTLLVCLLFCVAATFGFAPSSDDAFFEDVQVSMKAEEGQKQYNIIKQEAKMPKYGSCWQKALEDLESGCKQLTDDVQTRLALSFANCFLTKTGKKIHPCNSEEDVTECLKNADDLAVSTMSTFFTHTHSMCFFLQSQMWHDETKKTVVSLVDASSKVSDKLETNSKLQDLILQAQKTVLSNEEIILQTGKDLKSTLTDSKHSVLEVLNEFKSSTNEQKMALFEVFDRISKLQNLVLGEFTGLYTLLFFVSAAGVAYLLTSTRRTSGARFGVFVVLTLNFAAEKFIINWVIQSEPVSTEAIIYEWIWICRKVTCLVCLTILTFVAYYYKDYETLNNKLLQEIRRESQEVKQLLNMFSHYSQPKINGGPPQIHTVLPNGGSPQITHTVLPNGGSGDMFISSNGVQPAIASQKIDFDSDDPEDNSYEPSVSLSSSSDDSSDETFETFENDSRPSSTAGTKSSTPLRDVTPSIGSSRKGTPQRELNTSRGGSPYNLRPRGGLSSGRGSPFVMESPQQFAATVDSLSRIAQMHSMKVRQAIQQGKMNISSMGQFSDED